MAEMSVHEIKIVVMCGLCAGERREGGDRDERPRGRGGRGGSGPPRRTEGGEERREYTTKGEREHDRRSRGRPGSERPPREEKKGGGGAHNWGEAVPANLKYVT